MNHRYVSFQIHFYNILTVTNLQHSVLSIDIYKKTSTPSSC